MKTKTVIYDNEEFIICGETPRLYKLRNLTGRTVYVFKSEIQEQINKQNE